MINMDEYFMREALKQATYALQENEIPIGAVIVYNDRIIARAFNQVEKLKDVTAHAEMIAITSASDYVGGKFLQNPFFGACGTSCSGTYSLYDVVNF